MLCVATLISSESYALTAAQAEDAARAINAEAVSPLHPERAFDLFVDGADTAGELRAKLTAAMADAPVDVVVQPTVSRRKRLLIADMDSTMIQQECIDELAAELGIRDKVAAITERAMRGELAFEESLTERVALLAGLSASVVEHVLAERILPTPGGRTLVRTMRASGAYTALVSGGFTDFVDPVARDIGFDEAHANGLLAESGVFTGKVAEPILGRDAKRERLLQLANDRAIPLAETLAVGDGANDLAMIETAGLGVAFRAKPAVAAQADAVIQHGDLTGLLYIQGYRSADFVID